MRPVLSPAESAALDRESAARGITVDSLMERAGRAVAREAASRLAGTYGRRVVIACGKGNNGGDGLVAARHLARWGTGVTVVLLAARDDHAGPAASNLRRLEDGGRARLLPFDATAVARELARADLAVDAVFGTGFRGRPEGAHAEAIGALGDAVVPVLSVDVPSGVNGETGAADGVAVRAEATVTFGSLKPGLLLHPGAALAGRVVVADIGFPPDLVRSDLAVVEGSDVAAAIPPRPPEAHKRSTGVVLVLGGSRQMTGAVAMMAGATARSGGGLVIAATVGSRLAVLQSKLTEAVFLGLPETAGGGVAASAARPVLERLEGADALALGPGMSTEPETADLIRELVRSSPVPTVLDADGLNAFAGRASELADRRSDLVLTPHAGELGRLAGVPSPEAASDRIGHARKLAAESGAVVLAKGNPTVVAAPSGQARINPTGGPALATGGTGDVLTGVIAALLARGLSSFDAASAGAFVHGLAGDLAAEELGDGTVASDVIARLPLVLRRLEGPAP